MQISETFVGFVSESRRNRISGALWGGMGSWWGGVGWMAGGVGMAGLGMAGLGMAGLRMAGGRDLARKVRESVSGLSKFTRPSTLTLLIRARSKKKKRPPARKGSAWGGRC